MDPDAPDPGGWPLSAAATALLRDLRTPDAQLLRLSVRELVVRDHLRVTGVQRRRWQRPVVTLAPGRSVTALPAPLPLLAEALRPNVTGDGVEASRAVRTAVGWRQELPKRLRRHALAALEARGLVAPHRRRVLGVQVTRWRRTPSGDAWATSIERTVRVPPALLPAAGLLLLLDEDVVRGLRDRAVEVGAEWSSGDLDALGHVLGDAGAGLDAASDGSSGGDGGDGGGGD